MFDYRHFGDSDGEPRQLLNIAEQLEDWNRAMAFARPRADVDGRRVVLWGTSFGGGHGLATAADEPQLAAVISQCPFTDGLASSPAIKSSTSLKVTARALREQLTA